MPLNVAGCAIFLNPQLFNYSLSIFAETVFTIIPALVNSTLYYYLLNSPQTNFTKVVYSSFSLSW